MLSLSSSYQASFATSWQTWTQTFQTVPATTRMARRRQEDTSPAETKPSVTSHVARALTCVYRHMPATMNNVGAPSGLETQDLTITDGVTYLAGCTDPDYQDSSCPDKGDFSGELESSSLRSLHRLTISRSIMGWPGLLQWHFQ